MKAEKTKQIITAMLICALAAALVWAGKEAAAGAASAVTLCLTVMIPSLYAFTVISKLLIATNIYKLIGRPFAALSRYIFRMPADFFPVFIISQLAGYPIGAALISEMHKQGRLTADEAEKMLCFCIAPGPAYIMAVSAAAAPDSPGVWGAVFISVMGANLILALVTAPFRKLPPDDRGKINLTFTADSFTSAVRSGAESMTMICGMIIFMAAILGIAGKAGILPWISRSLAPIFGVTPAEIYPFVRSFFEISNLTGIFGDGTEIIPAAAAMLSFGGVCVHMQIRAVCEDISPSRALISRIPSSSAAYIICRSLMPKFYTVSVISVTAPLHDESAAVIGNNSPILSIILLIMTILIISQKSIVKNKKM